MSEVLMEQGLIEQCVEVIKLAAGTADKAAAELAKFPRRRRLKRRGIITLDVINAIRYY